MKCSFQGSSSPPIFLPQRAHLHVSENLQITTGEQIQLLSA